MSEALGGPGERLGRLVLCADSWERGVAPRRQPPGCTHPTPGASTPQSSGNCNNTRLQGWGWGAPTGQFCEKTLRPPSGRAPAPLPYPPGSLVLPALPHYPLPMGAGALEGVLEVPVADPGAGQVTHTACRERIKGLRGVTTLAPGVPASKWRGREPNHGSQLLPPHPGVRATLSLSLRAAASYLPPLSNIFLGWKILGSEGIAGLGCGCSGR